MTRFLHGVVVACWCLCAASQATAQFGETEAKGGPVLGAERTQRWKVGMVVTAKTPCMNVFGTLPVPTNWPEQDVKVVEEQLSPTVNRVQYRDLEGGIRQMLVKIPQLTPGQKAEALITVEVTRRTLDVPADTSVYQVPKHIPRDLRKYLSDSPLIDSRDRKLRELAKDITEDKENAWQKVEAIHNWVQENIKHSNEKFKGTEKALSDKSGHIEDLTGLFIAMCRAQKIPARTVWVPDYCYAEFYLEGADDEGYWFPCELKEKTVFGAVPNAYIIMQKGDNIKVPEKDKPYRLVPEFVTGKGQPQVSFVRQVVQ
jgi:hypothetical protein